MKSFSTFCLVAISQVLLVIPVAAHHGNASHFEVNTEIGVEGIVTRVDFDNPHIYVYFNVEDEQGQTSEWRCESTSSSALKRFGWTEETLVPDQVVRIQGNPARREERFCFVKEIFIDDVRFFTDRVQPNTDSQELAEVEPVTHEGRPSVLENGQPNISGYWYNPHWGPNRLAPYPPDGGYLRTEAGQLAADNFDDTTQSPALFCKPHNIIRAWSQSGLVNRVSQSKTTVTILNGYMDFERTIHLNQSEHPEFIEPSTPGHSIGWWEGDTLVVDTIGFSEGSIFPRNDVMHSDQMHTIERFRFNPETQMLERSYSVEDPLYLAQVHHQTDYQVISPTPYEPYGCVSSVNADNSSEDH